MVTADIFERARRGIFPVTSPTNDEMYDDHARSLLLYALRCSRLSSSALDYILHHPAQQPQYADCDGSKLTLENAPSALHRAAQWNNAAAIVVLVNFRSQFYSEHHPFQKHAPTESNVRDVTRTTCCLLESVDKLGQTPLIVAVRARAACSALVLLELGANVNAADYQNVSPLHWAANNGDKLLVKVLMAYSADIHATDAFGCTALHRSVSANSPFTIRTLCQAKADVHVRDRTHLRAIDYAPGAVNPLQQFKQDPVCELHDTGENQGKQVTNHALRTLALESVDRERVACPTGEEERCPTRKLSCEHDQSADKVWTRYCHCKAGTKNQEWSAAQAELKAHHRWSLRWCVRRLRVESMTPCVWFLCIVGVTMLETSLPATPDLMITLCRASFMLSFFLWSWFQYSDPGYIPRREPPATALRTLAKSLIPHKPRAGVNDLDSCASPRVERTNAPASNDAESALPTMTCDDPGTSDQNSVGATSDAAVTDKQHSMMTENTNNCVSPLQGMSNQQRGKSNASTLQEFWTDAVSFWTSSEYHKRRNALNHVCDKCWIVQAPRTRHCRACDACVEHFDHHCTFLGQCVGKSNHQIFIGMNSAACVTAVIFLCCAFHNVPPQGDTDVFQYLIGMWEQETVLFCLVTSMVVLVSFTYVLATQVYLISRNQTMCEWSRFGSGDPRYSYVGKRTFCEGSAWKNVIAFCRQRRRPG